MSVKTEDMSSSSGRDRGFLRTYLTRRELGYYLFGIGLGGLFGFDRSNEIIFGVFFILAFLGLVFIHFISDK